MTSWNYKVRLMTIFIAVTYDTKSDFGKKQTNSSWFVELWNAMSRHFYFVTFQNMFNDFHQTERLNYELHTRRKCHILITKLTLFHWFYHSFRWRPYVYFFFLYNKFIFKFLKFNELNSISFYLDFIFCLFFRRDLFSSWGKCYLKILL